MHHYQHHIGDYRRDTGHLSNEEDLAYRRMIELYYDTESPLPENVEWIARRARVSAEIVARVLSDFFVFDEEKRVWRQSRCEREIGEYRKAQKRNRNNGLRGGRPSKRLVTHSEPTRNPVGFQEKPTPFLEEPNPFQKEPSAKATVNRKPLTDNREPVPDNQSPETERAAAREPRSVVPPKPEDVTDQTWADWLAHRRRKRAIVNETVLAEFRREAVAAGVSLEEAIKTSVAQGWQGFRSDWVKANAAKATNANGRPVIAASRIHMQNMPLGSPTCECAECVSFRSRKAQ